MHYCYRKEQSSSLARLPAQPSWAIPMIWGVEVIMSQWLFICMSCQHNLPVIVTHIQHLCIDTDRGNCDGSQNGKSQHVLCLNTAIQMKEHFQIPWIGINSPLNLTCTWADYDAKVWLKSTADWLPIMVRKVALKESQIWAHKQQKKCMPLYQSSSGIMHTVHLACQKIEKLLIYIYVCIHCMYAYLW